MIKLESVDFDYTDFKGVKRELLRDISFEIQENERLVLLGINGSGKSTLLKILNGLIFPSKGELSYKNEKITKKSLKKLGKIFRKDVVFLMQDPNTLLFNATVEEEIAFGLEQFGFEDIADRVSLIAKKFNLEKHLKKPPFFLSGGEKQRVVLASLLAIEPKVMLMDEPSANLDPMTTGWLIDLLNDMQITTITSTHNLSLASEFGERALILSDEHKLIFDGKISECFKDKELMIEAKLIHKHKHKHKGEVHSHYHIHDWI